jgi:hypothetical protein
MYDVDTVAEMVHEKHHVFSVNMCEKICTSPDTCMDMDWWMECGEDTQSPMLPDRTDLIHGHGLVDGVRRGYTVPHVA